MTGYDVINDIKFWIETYQQEYIADDEKPLFEPHADTYNIRATIQHTALNHVRIFGNKTDRDRLIYLYKKANRTNKNGDWLRLFAHYSDMKEKEEMGDNIEEEKRDLRDILGWSAKIPYVWAIPRDEIKDGAKIEWGYLLGNLVVGARPPNDVIIRPVIFIPLRRKIYSDDQLVWGLIKDIKSIKHLEMLLSAAADFTIDIELPDNGIVFENKWIGNIETMKVRECPREYTRKSKVGENWR